MEKEIILAAGCFWGVQAIFDKLVGVKETEVGYIGGKVENPTYEQVSGNTTGHAEAVRIIYDDDIISLEEILDVFFQSHNPTTLNRQGPDVGNQYRSAIFYITEKQKKIIMQKIKEYQPFFKNSIVTEVLKANTFYPAEDYQQKYLEKTGTSACYPDVSAFDREAYYKAKMSEERYKVMREKSTEKPHSGKYVNFTQDGVYYCGACGQRLFSSKDKFYASCGWPSFDKALEESVKIKKDFSHFMIRNEVVCSRCGSHLGHVFNDQSRDTNKRFCINSIALDFEKNDNRK